MPILGVNIDHIATLRQARGGSEPDPVLAARACEAAGCDSIVAHLREDRRHMQDRDLYLLRKTVRTRLNMEMSIAPEIVKVALDLVPDQATLVPERRQELTTEGGLDCVKFSKKVTSVTEKLQGRGITVSLFIDPVDKQVKAARATGAEFIELHTGEYSNAKCVRAQRAELKKLKEATEYAISLGLRVNAGHGLNYINVRDVARIEGMEELNIGHSIISRAAFVGLEKAVREMIGLIR
ncbi:MAG TPA: pyridoxine 5'-phosphate synthase [Candidatus Omnitrophota bacterium]|nr:pyridoxine 5'-phosphate synthase [Candidatus Omnitrophota bacterium]HOX10323.1 pyridoxine 5'-phosphate synthase [Candidatus Omnitrophota bacterium]HRZ67254.1 pyridoxine 5'-phosphate synthase [Candidatus Omnitrophota bacterium]